jgi:chromosome segregation ATPase
MDVLRVLIAIDDTEFIHLRLQELEAYQNDSNVAIILKKLLAKDFEEAQDLMKSFINQHRPLRVCIEPPIDNLRREIQRLEEEIAATSREYSETQKTLEEFSQLHTEALGDLLQKILLQSKIKAKIEAQENEDKKAEFEEANKDYEEYTKSHEEAKQQQPTVLTKEEKKELKKLYRRTSLQCHPDRVVEELHQEAEALFVELNEAYKANDLNRLREISEQLKTGSMLSKSEGITELKKLESTVHSLTQKLKDWETKLDKLKAKPTYQKVFDIDDWEVYFSETKVLLESQLERLEAFIAESGKPGLQTTFLTE